MAKYKRQKLIPRCCRHVGVVMSIVAILAIWVCDTEAQQMEGNFTFEAASVKLSAVSDGGGASMRTSGGPGTSDPTSFTCANCLLVFPVMTAFGVKHFQVFGPSWLDTERVDITAKIAGNTTVDQFRQMMRHLLEDRFHLVAHRENREMPVLELTQGKGAVRLKQMPDTAAASRTGTIPEWRTDKDGYPERPDGPLGMSNTNEKGRIQGIGTLDEFAELMMYDFGRPVKNATGLKGRYNIKLSYIPDWVADSEPGPTLQKALQTQLGLKLNSKRAMVEVLAIDHIENVPTEN